MLTLNVDRTFGYDRDNSILVGSGLNPQLEIATDVLNTLSSLAPAYLLLEFDVPGLVVDVWAAQTAGFIENAPVKLIYYVRDDAPFGYSWFWSLWPVSTEGPSNLDPFGPGYYQFSGGSLITGAPAAPTAIFAGTHQCPLLYLGDVDPCYVAPDVPAIYDGLRTELETIANAAIQASQTANRASIQAYEQQLIGNVPHRVLTTDFPRHGSQSSA